MPAVSGGTATTGGLTFTLNGSAAVGSRDRSLADAMLTDFAFVDGADATMTLLIQGLPAGTYAVESYHYDGGGFAGAVRVESHPQSNPANNTVVLANFAYATTAATYTFTTNGTAHELVFRENDGNNRLRLNGLRLRVSGTATSPPGIPVDIKATNTAAVGGSPSPFFTEDVNAAGFTNGSLWRRRAGLGFAMNGAAEIFEKDANGGVGDAAALVTTATGLVPGKSYGVHVAFLSIPGENWQAKAGLTASSLELFTATMPAGRITDLGLSPEAGSNRNQYLGFVGNAVAAQDGTLQLFADDGDGTAMNWATRTWLEGFFLGDPITAPPLPGDAIELAPNGAWTWFNDERAILHQGSLYTGYVKGDGQTGISRRDLAAGTNSHMVISTATSVQLDDHNNPSITVLPDGKLMALYSKHIAGARFFQRTSLVQQPSTNADWGPEVIIPMPANNTYANTYRLSGESNAIYNFSRCINFNPTLTISTNNGATWGSPRQLVGTGSGNTRPYPRYCSNGTDRIDLIYTDGHPRDVENSVYHMFYRAGGLYKTDGTLIDSLGNIPLDHDAGKRGNTIYQFSNAAWGPGNGPNDWIPTGRGWTWDVHYGQGGAPTCVFQVQRDDVTGTGWNNDRIYYYYARWTGTEWQRRFIAQGGRPIYSGEDDYGGGMCLDPEDPRIVYISTNAASPFALGSVNAVPLNTGERFEIYKGFTADGGLTFTWTPITENSSTDNLRPIVPTNHGREECLLWFNGVYTTYTNFSTKVLGRIGEPVLTYTAWAAAAGAGPASADDDHDGQSNFLEYALQGDPQNGANPKNGVWAGGALEFPLDRNRADAEWIVEHSTDLTNWDTAAVLRSVRLTDSIAAGYTAEVPALSGTARISLTNPGDAGKRFFRLTVKSVR